jgi:hypothetical protein
MFVAQVFSFSSQNPFSVLQEEEKITIINLWGPGGQNIKIVDGDLFSPLGSVKNMVCMVTFICTTGNFMVTSMTTYKYECRGGPQVVFLI